MKVLVTAASKYGATGEIAQAIGNVLTEYGFDTKVVPPEAVGMIEAYDAIVLGSAVYADHWLEPAKELVRRSRDAFTGRQVWIFSSGPVGDPKRKMVRKMGEEPVDVAEIREMTKARDHRVFEGNIDRKNLSFPERALLLAFRGLEGDFRDWTEIKKWASEIANAMQSGARG